MGKLKVYFTKIKQGRGRELFKQIAWVYKYLNSNIPAVIIYTLLGMTGSLTSIIGGFISRDLVDIITGHQTGRLLVTFCEMIGIAILTMVISQASGYISAKITVNMDNDIKAKLFDEIVSSEWEYLAQFHSGDLVARWNRDSAVVSTGLLMTIPNYFIFTFGFVSSLIVVLQNDWTFAVFALASMPLSFLASRQSLKLMQKSNMNSMSIGAKMSSFNQEVFSNIQNVKAFDMVHIYSKRLRLIQEEYANVRMHYQKVSIINAFILTIVSIVVSYSAQGWGIYRVWAGAITYGTMTMFIALSSSLSSSVNNLISLVPQTIMLGNAAKRIMEVTEFPKEDYSQSEEVREFYNKHKDEGIGMSIRDLEYSYPTSDVIFTGVSFDAHPHEVIAIVGPSGEGKTTLLRYLLALTKSETGAGYITYGKETPESSDEYMLLTASARQVMAYVPQGNTMFSGTIAENMRNVKEDATDDEIIAALKLACAWDFVEKLPDGIDSVIMERGGGFSEGQAQRLSIARALLRKSPILLLDEATSALDMDTEKSVLKNIMEDDYPRTCILTTHRPSVLDYCTRVYEVRDKALKQVK